MNLGFRKARLLGSFEIYIKSFVSTVSIAFDWFDLLGLLMFLKENEFQHLIWKFRTLYFCTHFVSLKRFQMED